MERFLSVSVFLLLLTIQASAACRRDPPPLGKTTDRDLSSQYSISLDELWDGVILVIMQRSEVQYISHTEGVIVAPPFMLCLEAARDRANVTIAYIPSKEEPLTPDDQLFRLRMLKSQLDGQLNVVR
jgi:hypothetical protein